MDLEWLSDVSLLRLSEMANPDTRLLDLASLATQICRTPVAFVLHTKDGVRDFPCLIGWNKPKHLAQAAFCDHALDATEFFFVSDAWKDGRFAHDLMVKDPPYFRFFAGAPLVNAQGETYGALCVLDTRPRNLGDMEAFALKTLAAQINALYELYDQIEQLRNEMLARDNRDDSMLQQAVRDAQRDALTGLPNRALFLDHVGEVLKEANEQNKTIRRSVHRQAAVLFIDLDRFKRINDTLGHAVGDLLLQEVALRFAACLRPDEVLARLGGDEFTILLPDVPDPAYVEGVAQMLIRTLRRPVVINGEELAVGASVGISFYPTDGEEAATLLKHADVAMYEAKRTGGYQTYKRDMNSQGYQHLTEEAELRRAIESDSLFLYYQPQVDLRTGALVGLEALARWRHPDRGLIPPSHFIALAEQTDLMAALGEWVLHRACGEFARLSGQGGLEEMFLTINMSSRQLGHPNLSSKVREILQHEGLAPNKLVLELSETALCAKGDDTPKTLRELRQMGVRLFVDDFGTGYTSLALLRRFPLDAIKIDQSFVAGLRSGSPDLALIRALIEMAHALGLQAVAEGVETIEQHDALHELGCDLVQGYLYGRPLPSYQLPDLLERARRGALMPMPETRNAIPMTIAAAMNALTKESLVSLSGQTLL